MMLMPGGWLNLIGWAVAAAASFGLLPFAPRIRWPTGLSGIILMTNAVNYGCSWWGFKAFSSPVDPLPRVSWWWWLLLAALHVFVALMQTAERMREEEEAAKHGGSSSSSNFGRRHLGKAVYTCCYNGSTGVENYFLATVVGEAFEQLWTMAGVLGGPTLLVLSICWLDTLLNADVHTLTPLVTACRCAGLLKAFPACTGALLVSCHFMRSYQCIS
jgi:hypothetical protein